MHLHGAHIAKAVLAPDLLVELIGRKKGVGVAHEQAEDAVFHIGQMDVLAPAVHTAVVGIQPESRAGVAPETGLGGIHLHPAHVGQNAGHQHLVVVGLGEEIVTAQFQRMHDGVHIVQAGGKDDGAVMPAAQGLTQLHAVGVRQQDVQQDHVKGVFCVGQCFLAGGCTHHLKPLLTFQKDPGHFPDHCIILHQQDTNHAAALPFLPKFWYTETTLQFSIPYLRYPDNRF